METNLDIKIIIEETTDTKYATVAGTLEGLGHTLGRERYGAKVWDEKCYPSEEKLRIWQPPRLEGRRLELRVVPYQWADLQAMRQVQPIGDPAEDQNDPLKYWLNAVALTANAVIETSDGKLVFHRKNKGAKHGSVHTFGGYVARADLERGGRIQSTLVRELMEGSELGLRSSEIEVTDLFGTSDGMPSILWGFGTAAVYGLVNTSLSVADLQQRIGQVSAEETLRKELIVVSKIDLSRLDADDIHPQTTKVVPVIKAICERR